MRIEPQCGAGMLVAFMRDDGDDDFEYGEENDAFCEVLMWIYWWQRWNKE